MKYQKVRDYLENKTLQELQSIQGKEEEPDIDAMHKNVLLSKTRSADPDSAQERIGNVMDRTQETILEKDSSYTATINFGSPKVQERVSSRIKPRVSKTSMGHVRKEFLGESPSLVSRKSKVTKDMLY